MNKKVAIYAGSFDPITNGHLWVIKEACKLFDKLIIAIASNADKKCFFSFDERVDMVSECTMRHPTLYKETKCECGIFQIEKELLVNYAKMQKVPYLIRGIRNESDYAYEKAMRYINADICDDIQTIYFIPPRDLCEISSSVVKGLVGFDGWEEIVSQYVPKYVFKKLKELNKARGDGPI